MKKTLIALVAAASLSGCTFLDEIGVDDAAGALMSVGTAGVLMGIIN